MDDGQTITSDTQNTEMPTLDHTPSGATRIDVRTPPIRPEVPPRTRSDPVDIRPSNKIFV